VTRRTAPMSILLDESTPVLAARPFLDENHRVIRHSEVCEPGAPDAEVVAQALLNQAVLLAVDLDMKRFGRRFGKANNGEKYKGLDLVFPACSETLAEKRVAQALSFIKHEWAYKCGKPTRRLWVDIRPHSLTSHR